MMNRYLEQKLPAILSILACGGVIGTTALAIHNTKKAEDKIRSEETLQILKKLNGNEQIEGTKYKRDIYLKCHISTILSGIATCACIIGSNSLSQAHEAALISAYGLINESFERYRGKVIEHHGIEEHRKILDEIAAEDAKMVDIYSVGAFGSPSLSASQLSQHDEIQLFYDGFSKRYFKSTLARVLDAEYNLNRNFTLGDVVLLNDWYAFLGLEQSIEGNELGWFLGMEDEYMWLDFDHDQRYLEDGTPYIYINMELVPSTNWQEEW